MTIRGLNSTAISAERKFAQRAEPFMYYAIFDGEMKADAATEAFQQCHCECSFDSAVTGRRSFSISIDNSEEDAFTAR